MKIDAPRIPLKFIPLISRVDKTEGLLVVFLHRSNEVVDALGVIMHDFTESKLSQVKFLSNRETARLLNAVANHFNGLVPHIIVELW